MEDPHLVEFSGASWALEASARSLLEARYDGFHKKIERLSLSDFDMDTTMVATIVQVLQKHNQNVKELSLQECSGHVDIIITAALTSTTTKIESLAVSIGRLATVAFSPIAHSLGVGLQITQHLQKLVLQSGSNVFFTLSTDAAISLEQGLAGNTSLQVLHVQSCRFGESSAVRSLARGIRRQRRLKDVRFKSCFVANGHALDDNALAELIRGLEHNTKLQSLDISGNKCLQAGIAALATLLDRTKLKTLDMSCQCIDQDEFMNVSMLVAALGRTDTLESIELRFNKLSDRDMAYLSAALSHNTSIKYVGLGSNHISNTGVSILASRIPVMKGLKRLVLTNNAFEEEGTLELARALELNMTLESVECDPTLPNYKQVRYYADLNWGGRRYLLGKNYSLPLLPSLWPLVLSRVDKIGSLDSGRERQADVLYCLLRHGPALFPM